jgi:hypothetical protein
MAVQNAFNAIVSAIPKQAPANYNSSELDPILSKLFGAADQSSANQWKNTIVPSINDSMQARGVAGGGIQQQALQNAGEQHATNLANLKNSYAMQLYQLWMDRVNSERNWQMQQQQLADARSAQNQQNRSGILGDIFSLVPSVLSGGLFKTGGGGSMGPGAFGEG